MALRSRLNSPVFKALLFSSVVYVAPVNYHDFGTNCWCSVLLSPKLDDIFGAIVWVAYVAWTVFLQGVLAIGLYFLFRHATRLFFAPIVAVGLFVVVGVPLSLVAVWLDARVVPFIYRESEHASIDWQESCRVEHAHLLAPTRPRYAFLERSGRAWIVAHGTAEPMVILPEGCRTVAYAASEGGQNELVGMFKREPGVTFGEYAGFRYDLFEKHVLSSYGKTWSPEDGYQFTPTSVMFQRQYYPGGCAIYGLSPHERRDVPSESAAFCPVLSCDSGSLGSLEGTAYSISERRVEIVSARGGMARSVDISKVGTGFVVLEGVSVDRRRLLIQRRSSALLKVKAPDLEAHGFSHEYSEITFDGQVVWRLPRIGEADDARIIGDSLGWVWWQSENMRAPICCVLEWNVSGRAGTHRVARGRDIISVSLHPTGRLIAVSVSDIHNTGEVPDAVYVIRTRDGVEVFRRYLPPLTKSRVQFLGRSLLAYTAFDGSDGFVRVVRVPASVVGADPGS